jgi:hypothetical protein
MVAIWLIKFGLPMFKYLADFLGKLGLKSSLRRRPRVISKILDRVRLSFRL